MIMPFTDADGDQGAETWLRLRTAMRAAGISQAQLARATDVSRTAVGNWLHQDPDSRTRPTLDNLQRIARVLHVDTEWLATGRGRGPDPERKPEKPVIPYNTRRRQLEHQLRKRMAPGFGAWHRRVQIDGHEIGIDYLSPGMAAQVLATPLAAVSEVTSSMHLSRIRSELWQLLVLRELDKRIYNDRRYCVLVIDMDHRLEADLDGLLAEAAMLRLEVHVVHDLEAAERVLR